MGRTREDTVEEKRRLVFELDLARREISRESALAWSHLNPATLTRESMQKHRWAWITGGVLGGLLLVRLLIPARARVVVSGGGNFRSDKSGENARKRGFAAIIGGLVFSLLRKAATNYATRHLKEHVQQYVDSFQQPSRRPDSAA